MSEKKKRSWLKLFVIGLGGAIAGLVGLVIVTLFLEGKEVVLGIESSPSAPVKPPPTASEILTTEMSGKIETAAIDPQTLTQPPEVALPTTAELEPRDISDTDEKAERKVTSIDKSPVKLVVDKAGSKISKNLDQKKVLSLLEKKLDCHPTLPAGTKSVKAEIKLSKAGAISNIKVTPSAAEKELAKCMRKKLAEAKALKPKNKAVAQITVKFKLH